MRTMCSVGPTRSHLLYLEQEPDCRVFLSQRRESYFSLCAEFGTPKAGSSYSAFSGSYSLSLDPTASSVLIACVEKVDCVTSPHSEAWLRTPQVPEEREMLHVQLNLSWEPPGLTQEGTCWQR